MKKIIGKTKRNAISVILAGVAILSMTCVSFYPFDVWDGSWYADDNDSYKGNYDSGITSDYTSIVENSELMRIDEQYNESLHNITRNIQTQEEYKPSYVWADHLEPTYTFGNRPDIISERDIPLQVIQDAKYIYYDIGELRLEAKRRVTHDLIIDSSDRSGVLIDAIPNWVNVLGALMGASGTAGGLGPIDQVNMDGGVDWYSGYHRLIISEYEHSGEKAFEFYKFNSDINPDIHVSPYAKSTNLYNSKNWEPVLRDEALNWLFREHNKSVNQLQLQEQNLRNKLDDAFYREQYQSGHFRTPPTSMPRNFEQPSIEVPSFEHLELSQSYADKLRSLETKIITDMTDRLRSFATKSEFGSLRVPDFSRHQDIISRMEFQQLGYLQSLKSPRTTMDQIRSVQSGAPQIQLPSFDDYRNMINKMEFQQLQYLQSLQSQHTTTDYIRSTGRDIGSINMPSYEPIGIPEYDICTPSYNFDTTSYNFDTTSYNFNMTSYDFDVPSYNFDMTSFGPIH